MLVKNIEYNDCGVRSVAALGDYSYQDVLYLYSYYGRKPLGSVKDNMIHAVLIELGYITKKHEDCKNLTVNRFFKEKCDKNRRYLITSRNHVFAVVNGDIVDDFVEKNSRKKIEDVFEVIYLGGVPPIDEKVKEGEEKYLKKYLNRIKYKCKRYYNVTINDFNVHKEDDYYVLYGQVDNFIIKGKHFKSKIDAYIFFYYAIPMKSPIKKQFDDIEDGECIIYDTDKFVCYLEKDTKNCYNYITYGYSR